MGSSGIGKSGTRDETRPRLIQCEHFASPRALVPRAGGKLLWFSGSGSFLRCHSGICPLARTGTVKTQDFTFEVFLQTIITCHKVMRQRTSLSILKCGCNSLILFVQGCEWKVVKTWMLWTNCRRFVLEIHTSSSSPVLSTPSLHITMGDPLPRIWVSLLQTTYSLRIFNLEDILSTAIDTILQVRKSLLQTI